MTDGKRLEAHNLGVARDGRTLFQQVSFVVEPGAGVWIRGPNGAGKTTLLRLLVGLSSLQQGHVTWGGADIHRVREAYHRDLLHLGHLPGLKLDLSPLDNLHALARLRGDRPDDAQVDRALAAVGLAGKEEVPVRRLSAGQKRRVGLARLWLESASLWVLDEPLTALDAQAADALARQFDRHRAAGGQVVLTSHQMLPGNAAFTEVVLG